MWKILAPVTHHKIIFSLLTILVIGSLGYYFYQRAQAAKATDQYLTATVSQGSLVAAVSASGQVAVSDQVDIKPKASAAITSLPVTAGQEIKTGQVIARLDSSDAVKAVKDAKTALETAQLNLDKLMQSADALSVSQAQNTVTQAQDTLAKLQLSQPQDYQAALDAQTKAASTLAKDYETVYNDISSTFVDLPGVITTADSVLHGTQISTAEVAVSSGSLNADALDNSFQYYDDRLPFESFATKAKSDYQAARTKYDANFTDYKNSSRYSDQPTVEDLLNTTVETAKTLAQAMKSEGNMLSYWVDYRNQHNQKVFSSVTTLQTSLNSGSSQASSHLSTLLNDQQTLKNDKDAVTKADQDIANLKTNQPLDLAAAQRSLQEKKDSLAKLQEPADALDIRSDQLTIQQRQDDLAAAQQDLAYYTVTAPFDGIIAAVNVKKGDTASSGTALVSLVTKQKIAEVTFNEIDAAKISVGQPATITFDALSGLSLTGQVASIDVLGTVSQGVVTYNVKILFDTQDDRVKPGMSLTAKIITGVRQDVLVVPSSAIKTQNSASYVQVATPPVGQPVTAADVRNQTVQIGLTNDSEAEVTSGLKAGDQVVTQVISAVSATTAAATNNRSILQSLGGGGGGGNFRGVTGGGNLGR